MAIEHPVRRISGFLPPCEDCMVGHPMLVDAYNYMRRYILDRAGKEHWQAWRNGLLHQERQSQQWSSFGVWCFLIYKGKPPRKGELVYNMIRYFSDGFFPENSHSRSRIGGAKVSKLLDGGGIGAEFLECLAVDSRRGLMNPYLMVYAAPEPENYKPSRPFCALDELRLPPVLITAVEKHQLPVERNLKLAGALRESCEEIDFVI